ncbi:hypothetical protein DMUE_6417, partial [Dictyocoela muelleri]
MESVEIDEYLRYCRSNDEYRFLYFHLTSSILWNVNGTILFQLQYSGHLIIWKFDELNILKEKFSSIVDTKVSKPLSMVWNEENEILIIIGKENRRVLIKVDELKLFEMKINENDQMNVEHSQLMKWKDKIFVLIESKMNYCFIS